MFINSKNKKLILKNNKNLMTETSSTYWTNIYTIYIYNITKTSLLYRASGRSGHTSLSGLKEVEAWASTVACSWDGHADDVPVSCSMQLEGRGESCCSVELGMETKIALLSSSSCAIVLKRSSTQCAVRRASGSWSQHSVIVALSTCIPCNDRAERFLKSWFQIIHSSQ